MVDGRTCSAGGELAQGSRTGEHEHRQRGEARRADPGFPVRFANAAQQVNGGGVQAVGNRRPGIELDRIGHVFILLGYLTIGEAPDMLKQAIEAGDANTLRELVTADPAIAARPFESGITPILLALYHQKPELARVLREHAGPLDWFTAAAYGDEARIAALLHEDANQTGAVAHDGNTALHLAAYFGHTAIVGALMRNGADPKAVAQNPSRVRPIHSAVAGSHVEVAQLLLEAGAEPNAAQHGGWTPIQAAAKRGDLAMVELLLQTRRRPASSRRQWPNRHRPRERLSGRSHETFVTPLTQIEVQGHVALAVELHDAFEMESLLGRGHHVRGDLPASATEAGNRDDFAVIRIRTATRARIIQRLRTDGEPRRTLSFLH